MERAESPQIGLPGHPPEGRAPGVWLASFKQHSAVHGEVGKSATLLIQRAPCFSYHRCLMERDL